MKSAISLSTSRLLRGYLLDNSHSGHASCSSKTLPCPKFHSRHLSSADQSQKGDQSQQPSSKKSFFGQLIDNLQDEVAKNKELKENMAKLKEQAARLEGAEAIKKARAKYQQLEVESSNSSEKLKQKAQTLLDQAKKLIEDSQVGRKGSELSESAMKSAREALESLESAAAAVGKSPALANILENTRNLQQELDSVILYRAVVYRRPTTPRKRTDLSSAQMHSSARYEANTEASDLQLHPTSRFYKSWKMLTEDNKVMSKFWDLKMKVDESENVAVRAGRYVTDKVGDAFTGLFGSGKISETMTEISKIDPEFNMEAFVKQLEDDIVPNVLESVYLHDLEVLKDWCGEVAYKQLSYPIEAAKQAGNKHVCRTLDISRIEFVTAKMLEQGPVIAVSFWAQQLIFVHNSRHEIIEGDAVKPLRVTNTWILCRDMEELNPGAAWRVLEVHQFAQTQLL